MQIACQQLPSVPNFRQLGGIKVANNRTITLNKIYRCGTIRCLEQSEKDYYDSLNIKYDLDYRGEKEKQRITDYCGNTKYIDATAVHFTGLNLLEPGTFRRLPMHMKKKQYRELIEGVRETYSQMPYHNVAFQKTFEVMNSGENFVIHCSGGKDRTGVGSALILLALGASDEDIVTNFLISNKYAHHFSFFKLILMSVKYGSIYPAILAHRFFGVDEEMMRSMLKTMHEKYPDYNDYLLKEYGISKQQRNKWIEMYTQPTK